MADAYTKDSLQIARLEERMAVMHRDMQAQQTQLVEMRGQLDQVLAALSEARGGWRTLMWIGGAAAAAGGFVSWFLNHVQLRP